MSGTGAGEIPPQRKSRINPRLNYQAVDGMVDDYMEISALTPTELKHYTGER